MVDPAGVSAEGDNKDEGSDSADVEVEVEGAEESADAGERLELFSEPPEGPDDEDEARDGAPTPAVDPKAPAPLAEEDEPTNVAIRIDTAPLPEETTFPARPLRVLVVGGARGGVGKTVLAANLGLYLSTIGRKVVLADADPAGANLHTCLGTSPAVPLSKMRRHGRASEVPRSTQLAEALQDSPFKGLRLLHLGLDEPAVGYRVERMAKLMGSLRELDAEYVVVDLGVGLTKEALDNYLAADLSLFVTVPEPTAIENSYRFMRGAFARYLLRSIEDEEARSEIGPRSPRPRRRGSAAHPRRWTWRRSSCRRSIRCATRCTRRWSASTRTW